MQLPNLNQIVDTFFKINDPNNFNAYITQLRTDLIPEIRKLQSDEKIIWYSFLIHDSNPSVSPRGQIPLIRLGIEIPKL